MTDMSITYPWPDYRITPNGAAKGRLLAILIKKQRTASAEITAQRGLGPFRTATPVRAVMHPPSARWDKDNARACGKQVFDGIADAMGVNDKEFDIHCDVGAPVKGGAIVVMFQPPAE